MGNNNANTTYSGVLGGAGSLTKIGGGTLLLSGNNAYSGGTTVSAGTLQLGDGIANNGYVQGSLQDNGAIVFANPAPQSFSNVISGSGSLTKSGSGTLLFSGSNTYAGGTTVIAGLLQVAGTAALPGYGTPGKITVGNGAVLAVSAGGSGWTAANIATLLSSNSSHFTTGSALGIDTTGGSLAYTGNLSGNLGLVKFGANALTLSAASTYNGNTLISGGTLALGSPLVLQNSTLDSSGSGTLSFGSLTAATLGGLTGPGALGLSNSGAIAVTLSVGNNNASTTYSGALSGSGSLTKIGSGTLLLSGNNTYSGGTTVSAGTLQLGDGVASNGFVQGNILNNGGVTIANPAPQTYSGAISGNGNLTKTGNGTLALPGSNTYSGPTAVNQGALVVDGWLTSSAVTVNSGGTLGGTGTLGGVTVNAGGHLAPGDFNVGTLLLAGNMDFEGGELDIVATGSSLNSLSIAGNLILSDDPTLNVSGSLVPGTYIIASYDGTLNGQFATPLDLPAGDTINYGTGSDSAITVSVVPEPSTLALLGAGAYGLAAYAWRRRRQIGGLSTRQPRMDRSPSVQ